MIKLIAGAYLAFALVLSLLCAILLKEKLKRLKSWRLWLFFAFTPILAIREAIIILCELFSKRDDK